MVQIDFYYINPTLCRINLSVSRVHMQQLIPNIKWERWKLQVAYLFIYVAVGHEILPDIIHSNRTLFF